MFDQFGMIIKRFNPEMFCVPTSPGLPYELTQVAAMVTWFWRSLFVVAITAQGAPIGGRCSAYLLTTWLNTCNLTAAMLTKRGSAK